MNLFIFPATGRIGRCHAFRLAGIVGRINKSHNSRDPYESRRRDFEKNDGRCKCFRALYSSSAINNGEDDDQNDFYKSVSSFLFGQGKTWKRLSHLLNMATNEDNVERNQISSAGRMKSVADIGTDHGLLAMGLALTGNYDTVIGVDISDQALTYGAFALLGKIQNQTMSINDNYFRNRKDFPIEFRLGNGLKTLENGEADVICIAGMGVNTMLKILDEEQNSATDSECTDLERIGCKRLVLQATNSRPRNLILLYNRLQKMGWKVRDERIEKLSSRWYMTTSFEFTNDCTISIQRDDTPGGSLDLELPGSKLISLNQSCSMRKIFDEYCRHHRQWIKQDAKKSSKNIDPRDLRWLEYFFDNEIHI